LNKPERWRDIKAGGPINFQRKKVGGMEGEGIMNTA